MTVDDFTKWNQEAEAMTVTKHELQWSFVSSQMKDIFLSLGPGK